MSYTSFFLGHTMDLQEKLTAQELENAAKAVVLRQELERVKAELAEVKDVVGAVGLENAKDLAVQEFLASEDHALELQGYDAKG